MTLKATVGLTRGGFELDVSLEVGDGELVAVLGPNGAGKSTLLRVLAGLLRPDRGEVQVDGEILDRPEANIHVPANRRSVGVVFQDYLLFPHLSAADNIAFGLRAGGTGKKEARARAVEWLSRLGLGEVADRRPRELSGGQAQRVALARALAKEPRLILLDEPLAALDVATRAEVRRDLRRHLSALGGARLLVTHDPLEAMVLADRMLIIEGGRIVQAGTPADVRQRPRSAYVAELVGLNLFTGTGRGDHVEVDGGACIAAPDAGSGRRFVVIRPRAVALHRRPPEGTPRNVWPGHVVGMDLEGERVRVSIDAPVQLVAEVTATSALDLRLADGGQVWASVKATDVDTYPA